MKLSAKYSVLRAREGWGNSEARLHSMCYNSEKNNSRESNGLK